MKMPKAYSLLLIGIGIFVAASSMYTSIQYSIDNELYGYPARHEIDAFRGNMAAFSSDIDPEYMEALRAEYLPQYIREQRIIFQVMFMESISEWGGSIGLLVLFSGGILLLVESLRHVKSNLIERKPVSLKWQTVCSFLPGFDLWALYRIQKLRIGSMVIAIMYASSLLSFYSITPQFEIFGFLKGAEGLIFAVFVYMWSRDWNRSLESKETLSKGNTPIFTG